MTFERLTAGMVAKRMEQGGYGYRPLVAAAFDVSVNDLVGSGGERKRKLGPASRIEQLAEELTKLPKNKQRLIVQMLEGFLHAS